MLNVNSPRCQPGVLQEAQELFYCFEEKKVQFITVVFCAIVFLLWCPPNMVAERVDEFAMHFLSSKP